MTAVGALAGVVGLASPAWAVGASRAEIVKPDGTPLNSGGSATTFGLLIPNSAHCPGDTTKLPFWRLYTYVVPSGTDLNSVNFKHGYPDRWYGLSEVGGYYGAINLAKDTGALLPEIPDDLSFAMLTASQVLPGGAQTAVWDVGVGCVPYQGTMGSRWNVAVAFTASRNDRRGFTWAVTKPVSAGFTKGFQVAGFAGAAILAIGAIVLIRRRDPEPKRD
jgi:hypothetical protein